MPPEWKPPSSPPPSTSMVRPLGKERKRLSPWPTSSTVNSNKLGLKRGEKGDVAMIAAITSNATVMLEAHQTFHRIRIAADNTTARPIKAATSATDGPGIR